MSSVTQQICPYLWRLSYTFENFFHPLGTSWLGSRNGLLEQTISGSNLATPSHGADSGRQRTSLPIGTLVDLKITSRWQGSEFKRKY